jgi:hypothetical protein
MVAWCPSKNDDVPASVPSRADSSLVENGAVAALHQSASSIPLISPVFHLRIGGGHRHNASVRTYRK